MSDDLDDGYDDGPFANIPLVSLLDKIVDGGPDDVTTIWAGHFAGSGVIHKLRDDIWILFAAHAEHFTRKTQIALTYIDPTTIVAFCAADDCPAEDRKLMLDARAAYLAGRPKALPAPPPAPPPGALTEDDLKNLGIIE